MPIKEFRCTTKPECRTFEKRFPSYEKYQADFATGKVTCPVCGKVPQPTVSHTAPPKFNGSGFYATDY